MNSKPKAVSNIQGLWQRMKAHPGGSCNGLFNPSQRGPKQGSGISLMIASRVPPKFYDGRLGFRALISCESRKRSLRSDMTTRMDSIDGTLAKMSELLFSLHGKHSVDSSVSPVALSGGSSSDTTNSTPVPSVPLQHITKPVVFISLAKLLSALTSEAIGVAPQHATLFEDFRTLQPANLGIADCEAGKWGCVVEVEPFEAEIRVPA
nr:uncharacterized protein LOC109176829 [Ipomoea batatas]